MVKNLISTVLLFGLFCLLGLISILIARSPSYTIHTSGILYIVNKLGKSITVFDLEQGEKLAELPLESGPRESAALTYSNRVVVSNYSTDNDLSKTITVINTKTNEVEKTISLKESLQPFGVVAFPFSDNVAVVTHLGNDLLVINVESGIVEKRIPCGQQVSHLLVLHPNKPLAYVTNKNSNSVSVIDIGMEQVTKVIPCGSGIESLDITPDGLELWVTNSIENTIAIVNTETLKITDVLTTGREPLRLKFSIDGKYCLVANSSDGTISVYDRFSKKQIKTIVIPGKSHFIEKILHHTPRPVGILMHPNGLYAFVANSNADKIEVIDMQTFRLVSSIGTGEVPDGMAFIE